MPWKRRGIFSGKGGSSQGIEDTFCGFAGAAVGGGEKVEGVIGREERAEFAACFFRLGVVLDLVSRQFSRGGKRDLPASILRA